MFSLSPGTVAAMCALLASCAGLALLLWRRRAVVGTTLFWPWLWSIAAFVALGAVEIAAVSTGGEASWLPAGRYMAVAVSLCPGVALLGAKRPQEGMWQLAVVAFLAMCWAPAVLQMVLRPGQAVELPAAIAWLLAAIVLLLVANHAVTRYWPSALLAGAGLALLFARQWPIGPQDFGPFGVLAGVACIDVAILLVTLGLPPRSEPNDAGESLWLDFRDAYGAVWALRIAERVNEAAAQNAWRVRLEWGGFQGVDVTDDAPPEEIVAASRLLRSLLRRFVSLERIKAG